MKNVPFCDAMSTSYRTAWNFCFFLVMCWCTSAGIIASTAIWNDNPSPFQRSLVKSALRMRTADTTSPRYRIGSLTSLTKSRNVVFPLALGPTKCPETDRGRR